MNKKLLILLCAIMATITANAKYYDFSADGICYEITDNDAKTVAVTYNNYDEDEGCPIPNYTGNITIPSSVSNDGITYTVTSIGNSAFYECRGLRSIVIPNSVTSIGSSAFSSCRVLTSIQIPNSVTSIGSSAFSYCIGLTSIVIPNSVTSIGSDVFSYCSGLTSIVIPNSVTSIGNYAFFRCNGLTSVTIHNSNPDTITLGTSVFLNDNTSNITLYVPAGSQDFYAAADQWKNLGKIVGFITITDGDDYTAPENKEGVAINYTRTFSNNYWQALYVPFTPNDAEAWGEDYEFAELASVATEGEDQVMTWAKVDVNALEAGKPYIVRYTGETPPGEVSMMFPNGSDVWADNYTTTDPLKTVASTTCTYDLYGNTTTQNLEAGAYALYQGNFYQSTGNNSLPAQRFYIKATVKTGQHAPARIKVKVGDEPAGVIFPEADVIFPIDENYYDLQGRRVEHPQRGQIYIHNGQKILK